jgi:poly(3-hydroxybutyrate) depolymerase
VRLWIGPAAASRDGPLVFYWHGTGSSPSEAISGLGQAYIDELTAAGGIVAAAYADPAAGTFPWFLTAARTRFDDLLVADEVLACARRSVGLDVRRIHTIGMSAGGLQSAQMSYRRSGYVASAFTYSGGLLGAYGAPARQDPSNRFAALVFHGGPKDVVVIDFQQASEAWWGDLVGHDQFAAICDHGLGHRIPTDARGSVRDFFAAHPFGVASPYAGGLPGTFPSSCALSP